MLLILPFPKFAAPTQVEHKFWTMTISIRKDHNHLVAILVFGRDIQNSLLNDERIVITGDDPFGQQSFHVFWYRMGAFRVDQEQAYFVGQFPANH